MHLSTTRRSQQGSGLILVIFIIVIVVGLVALVVNRNQQRSSDQLVASVIGTRAEMAARSAAQIEVNRFYLSTNTGSCHTDLAQTISFQGDGLEQCTATVRCIDIGILDDGSAVHRITSIGQCSVGSWTLQREIEVGLRDDS